MRRRSTLRIWVFALMLLIGLGILLFPVLNNLYTSKRMESTVESFFGGSATEPDSEAVVPSESPETEPTIPHLELLEMMQAYNQTIYETGQEKLSSLKATEEPAIYYSIRGQNGDMFGVLRIPKLGLEMPLYLGATDKHMAYGAAQLGQTSIPIGGENTNSVIAGHRGYNGADYFRYVPDLQIGDAVSITNHWETLRYTVVETQIIQPNDIDAIKIQPGRDLVTLLTCHPYASGGKQRFLVICERTEA